MIYGFTWCRMAQTAFFRSSELIHTSKQSACHFDSHIPPPPLNPADRPVEELAKASVNRAFEERGSEGSSPHRNFPVAQC